MSHRLLLALASLLLLLAVILPAIDTERPRHRYLLGFDISQSMDVADMATDGGAQSRLDAARRVAAGLLTALPCGSELGYSVLAGGRTILLISPLEVCDHYDALLASLAQINGTMRFENASQVGKGLHQSLRSVHALGERTALVLFSDGHEAPPLAEGQTGIPRTEDLDVTGTLIGIGGDQAVRIPKSDATGRQVGYWSADDVVQRSGVGANGSREELSALDEAHLESLARLAALDYRRLDDIPRTVAYLRDRPASGKTQVRLQIAWLPAGLALLLLLWRYARGLRISDVVPRRYGAAPPDLPAVRRAY